MKDAARTVEPSSFLHNGAGNSLSRDLNILEAQNIITGHTVCSAKVKSFIAEIVKVESAANTIAKQAK